MSVFFNLSTSGAPLLEIGHSLGALDSIYSFLLVFTLISVVLSAIQFVLFLQSYSKRAYSVVFVFCVLTLLFGNMLTAFMFNVDSGGVDLTGLVSIIISLVILTVTMSISKRIK
jgi:hypothetical protein